MAKRRRSRSFDSENWSYKEQASSSGDSEIEDASFGLKSKPSTSHKRTLTVKRKKPKADASTSHISDVQEGYVDVPHHPKSAHSISSPAVLRTALLKWYKTVHDIRGMPWRRPYDPNLGPDERAQRAYEVWISEIMLQQTQVATVIPYYNCWMEKFPTIRDLAGATIDEVNRLWKGLGYYSRASRLLIGAQKAVRDYDAKLPDNAKDMEANIPGIGRYSAGAICSIAYGEPVPVLDGNVHRLLSRVLALHAPPKAKSTLDILWTAARTMVEIEDISVQSSSSTELRDPDFQTPQYPGDINQALIELGSTVCKVREPDCPGCPLRPWCSGYQNSVSTNERADTLIDIEDSCRICEPVLAPVGVTSYPMKADRKKAREELDVVHVIEWHPKTNPDNRLFLMIRRPESGLLAGLYDFPASVDVPANITRRDQEAMPSEILSHLVQGGAFLPSKPSNRTAVGNSPSQTEVLIIAKIKPVGDVLHIFSHIKKTYRVQWVVLEGGVSPPAFLENQSLYNECPNKKPKKKKRAVKDVNVKPQINDQKAAIWVPLEEVMETNMGSGVVKVWNITKKLWESPTDS
ncbi:hypothetical protein GALMADRAFT_252735 [Galerina marginata CBS 339.88]|uniref:Adenine DNA glycosylase n=1 Tax=Galerina marginata (strain CBS 339.88) TaxID=685588 RepID=A0A067SNS6_GALM3|nr:hypothetical protein GALMADRAFT_252735 [Galerina marginata CBS 339.88]